jgi:hypothetical protein
MTRFLVLALVASVGHASVAFAGDSLLTSGARHIQQIARGQAADAPTGVTAAAPLVAAPIPAGMAVAIAKPAASAFQEAPGTLARSGMRKRTKILIALGLGLGFAASAWTIDHKVLDITPSSLGTRED